jgi:hypothetical protein
MRELEEAIARLERAVAWLEAACQHAESRTGLVAGAPAAVEPAADGDRQREVTAAIVARVDAALERIGRVLEGDA